MHRRTAGTLAATATIALTATLVAAPADASKSTGKGAPAVGLAGKHLVGFRVDSPERARSIGRVTGLTGDTRLVGIDYRVQDRKLYGVGNEGGVYVLSTRTARATEVSRLTVDLDGSRFGVDFNPAADRLRITSNTGQNLRHDVNAGGVTIADSTLTYPPATTPAGGVSGSAYTNNDLDADTATTLFDIDTALDQVALQVPANAGTLSPTGMLGVNAGSSAGFDIYSDLKRGVTASNKGYATLSVGGRYRLFTVSLLTGDVRQEGRFPSRAQVSDIAVKLDRHGR